MNQLADFVLMYTDNIQKAIDDKRADMCITKTGGGSSNHAFVSDPTCQKAMRNILPVGTVIVPYGPKIAGQCDVRTLKNPEKWLYVVKITWDWFKERPAHKVMVLRYKQGYTNMFAVARELDLSVQRCYVMLDDVHRYLISYAQGYGAYEIKTKHLDRLEEIMTVIGRKKEDTLYVKKGQSEENIFTI